MRLPPILRALLWPLSVLYGAAALRVWLYRNGIFQQRRLPVPVISVGNLTVGGTGKTPLVLLLAERFLAQGKRVAILSRGYRAPSGSQSDEVQLLSRRLQHNVQIGVGADRFASAQTLLRHNQFDYFLLDDGFQHLAIARDADIVLIDSTDSFGDAPFPAGRAREFRSALARADILVITRTDRAPAIETILRHHSSAPVFYAQTELDRVIQFNETLAGPATPDFLQQKFFAICGIGNPAQFFHDLRRWGFNLVGQRAFPDHHRFTLTDLDRIQSAASAAGAEALICTEKDVFNLPPESFRKIPAYYARIRLALTDEPAFFSALDEILRRRAAANPERRP